MPIPAFYIEAFLSFKLLFNTRLHHLHPFRPSSLLINHVLSPRCQHSFLSSISFSSFLHRFLFNTSLHAFRRVSFLLNPVPSLRCLPPMFSLLRYAPLNSFFSLSTLIPLCYDFSSLLRRCRFNTSLHPFRPLSSLLYPTPHCQHSSLSPMSFLLYFVVVILILHCIPSDRCPFFLILCLHLVAFLQ